MDETPRPDEAAEDMVLRLAREKALALDVGETDVVIGADTAVVVDHIALGKPRDEEDAVSMLMRLSGRRHSVVTGVAVRAASGIQAVLSATNVQFRDIGQDEARAYWQSGEPHDHVFRGFASLWRLVHLPAPDREFETERSEDLSSARRR